jgi:uncharacterized protein
MVYNVAGLLKAHTGETRDVLVEAWPDLGEPDVRLLEPVRGEVHLTRDHAGILVRGRLATRMRVPCARCLGPAESEVVFDLVEHFRPTLYIPGGPPIEADPEGDAATEIDGHHQVDLSEVVRQAVLLAVPVHPLCRGDCRGLCPQCGRDLNEGACGCAPEPDPRWQALRALLDELVDDES